MQSEIPKIVLTGGPCSGKTTGLAYLMEKLFDFGFMVFSVPETATLLIISGLDPRKITNEHQQIIFEETLFDMQLDLEKHIEKAASRIFSERKKVILCDRGIMDIKAYLPEPEFFKIMAQERGKNVVELRDSYNGIIHLITAACGAKKFYTCENNKARIETPEEAMAIDQKILECWLGHPHLKIIGNETDFEHKIKRTLQAICRFLGIPVPIEIERKFLAGQVNFPASLAAQRIEIEQIYLNAEKNNEELRIRKRSQDGSSLYFLTRKTNTDDPAVRSEKERVITPREFFSMQKLKDPGKNIIIKERICFIWKNQYFELDFFKAPAYCSNLILLEIELTERNERVEIPPFIKIKREVTGDERYRNSNLAMRPPR